MGVSEERAAAARACEICGRLDLDRALAVDHCHVTGAFRGFLCGLCNKGLGLFKDSPDLLLKAVDYLRSKDAKTLRDASGRLVVWAPDAPLAAAA